MSGYGWNIGPDNDLIEIGTSLVLTKDHMISALAYLIFGHPAGSAEEREACEWLAKVDHASALEVVVDNVITYGQANIHEHEDSPAIEQAARAAVERLWPGLA